MISRIVVLGGGSAGLLCALGLKSKLPELGVQVVSVPDPLDPPAQSANISLTRYLHGFLGLKLHEFIGAVRPMLKLGIKFEQWGPRDHYYLPFGARLDQRTPELPRNIAYYCDAQMDYATPLSALMAHDKALGRNSSGAPLWHWDIGYQLPSDSFKAFLRERAIAAGAELVEGTFQEATQNDAGITGLTLGSGQKISADLYIDCSGRQSLLLGKALNEPFVSFKKSLPCDRMLLGGWDRTDEPVHPFTTSRAMDSGWSWQIELERRVERGYVFSSQHASDEQAREEFAKKNPNLDETNIVAFESGRYERPWVKNVIAIGAAEGFAEPLEATELDLVAARSQLLSEILMETSRQVPAAHVKLYNRHHGRIWDGIRRLLAIHYRFNDGSHQTPFWEMCRREIDLAGAEAIVEYYRQCGPNSLWGPLLVDPVDPFNASTYLTVLVGQKVPTKVKYDPSPGERATWDARQQRLRAAAMQGVGVIQALKTLPREDASET